MSFSSGPFGQAADRGAPSHVAASLLAARLWSRPIRRARWILTGHAPNPATKVYRQAEADLTTAGAGSGRPERSLTAGGPSTA